MTPREQDLQQLYSLSPFIHLLEIVPVDSAPGRAVCSVRLAERHARSLGMAHGGVAAALLDTAMGFAARTVAPSGHDTVTVQLSVNYVRPALIGEELRATGTARHNGKRTAVIQGEVVNEKDELTAIGSATMMFVPIPPSQPGS